MKRIGRGSLALLPLLLAAAPSCGGSTNTGGTPACDAGTCPSGGTGGTWTTGGTGGIGGTGAFGATGGLAGAGALGGFGGTAGGVDPVEPGAQPPPPPSGPPAAGSGTTVIAVDKLLLGDTDAQGNPDPNAWRHLGYNIDGIISTKNGSNHCKPQLGASPSSVKTDGDNGIDNSFGSNFLPILGSLASNPSQTISASIANGDFTLLFRLDKLADPLTAPDQTLIAGSYYGGAKFDALVNCLSTPSDPHCSPPKFDGSDAWPVVPELLNGGNIDDPKLKFPQSYVSSGTWVSASQASIGLSLSIQGFPLNLPITHALFSMKLQGAGTTASATGGVIAGVIPTEAFIGALKQVVGGFDQSLCSGATFDSIAQQVRAASDIMQDGTNGDPTTTCDAISIGLGFEGRGVSLGGVAAAVPPPVDPCAN